MATIKVIHLELEGEHYYFGSPKAMFDIMGSERLGMTYRSFHSNIHLKVGVPYHNRRQGYIIRVGILGQAKTNRNNKLAAIHSALVKGNVKLEDLLQQNAEAVAAQAVAPTSDVAAQAEPAAVVPAAQTESAAPAAARASVHVTPAHPEAAPKRKKKSKDVPPEQLTLF